jgi:hypothetical protein
MRDGLLFDLPNALFAKADTRANFFQGVALSILKAETEHKNGSFPAG